MTASALMSLKPVFAAAILNGEKTVELRRRRPGLEPGTRVLIYASSPQKEVVGWFDVGTVLALPPPHLWAQVRERAGVSYEAYQAYFAGCETAYGIEVVASGRVEPTAPGIRPPQSWQYLRGNLRSHRALMALPTPA